MARESITVAVERELSPEEVSELIGTQLIEAGEGKPFSYLAGLAFDGMSGHSDIVGILMEYLRNETAFDLRDDELAEVENILSAAYGSSR